MYFLRAGDLTQPDVVKVLTPTYLEHHSGYQLVAVYGFIIRLTKRNIAMPSLPLIAQMQLGKH